MAPGEKPQPLSPQQAIRLAEIELAALKPWLSADPNTPHTAETGHRLAELAQILIKHGTRS